MRDRARLRAVLPRPRAAADGRDFGRTIHAWLAALVAHRAEAEAAVGAATYRRFKTYLAASEVQFRLRAITNYRLVLERRPSVRC